VSGIFRRAARAGSEIVPGDARGAGRHDPEGGFRRAHFDGHGEEGDTVRGRVLDDVLVEDGSIAAASGSRVVGRIDHVVDSGKLARPAELTFRLTELETRGGTVPIRTSAYERVGKTHTKRNVEYIAGGAAVGAIIGQVLGKDHRIHPERSRGGRRCRDRRRSRDRRSRFHDRRRPHRCVHAGGADSDPITERSNPVCGD